MEQSLTTKEKRIKIINSTSNYVIHRYIAQHYSLIEIL